jgi:hypothetical protein
MADRITYVGLDVHKESIVVAVAAGGLRGEVREYGRIANTSAALDRLLRKLGGDGMGCGFATRRGHAVMAFNVDCRPGGTSASWSPPR